jgi:hypothetical protein
VLATPNNKLIYVSASRPLEIPDSFPHILQDSNTSDLFFFSFACVCCKKKRKKNTLQQTPATFLLKTMASSSPYINRI